MSRIEIIDDNSENSGVKSKISSILSKLSALRRDSASHEAANLEVREEQNDGEQVQVVPGQVQDVQAQSLSAVPVQVIPSMGVQVPFIPHEWKTFIALVSDAIQQYINAKLRERDVRLANIENIMRQLQLEIVDIRGKLVHVQEMLDGRYIENIIKPAIVGAVEAGSSKVIRELSEQMRTVRGELNNLILQIRKSIDRLNTTLDTLQVEVQNRLVASVDNLIEKSKLGEILEKLTDITVKLFEHIDNLSKNIESMSQMMGTLIDKLTVVSREVGRFADSVKQLNEDINRLREQVAKIEASVMMVSESVRELRDRVESIVNTVETIKSEKNRGENSRERRREEEKQEDEIKVEEDSQDDWEPTIKYRED